MILLGRSIKVDYLQRKMGPKLGYIISKNHNSLAVCINSAVFATDSRHFKKNVTRLNVISGVITRVAIDLYYFLICAP